MALSLDLATLEAAFLFVMGAALIVLGGVFLLTRRVIDRLSAGLILLSGVYAVLWRQPTLLGAEGSTLFHVEIAHPVFLLLISGAVFLWAYWLFERHVERLESTAGELSRTLELEETLLDVLGHDLRNRLTSFMLRLEELGSGDAPQDGPAPEALAALLTKVQEADDVIENALVLSSASTDGSVELNPLDLREIARSAVEVCQERAAMQGIPLELDARGEVLCRAHPSLVHAVENLLDNAIKWGPRDEPVQVRVREGRAGPTIQVIDHGPGIPSDEKVRLLGRFERGTRGSSGSGLGLAIVSRIVDLHGGHLGISETPGGGSTLTLVLDPPVPTDPGSPSEQDPRTQAVAQELI